MNLHVQTQFNLIITDTFTINSKTFQNPKYYFRIFNDSETDMYELTVRHVAVKQMKHALGVFWG